MSELILEKVRTTQPQIVTPLNSDLRVAAAITPTTYPGAGTNKLISVSAKGVAFDFANGSPVTFGNTAQDIFYLSPGWAAFVFNPGDSSNWSGTNFIANKSDSNGARGWTLYHSSVGSISLYIINGFGNRYVSSGGGLLKPNTWHTLIINFDGNPYTGGLSQIYVDGILAVSSSIGGGGHLSDSTQTLQLGSGVWGAAANSKGYIALAAFGRKMLNTAEVKSLSDNPWQVFSPERRVLSFDSAVVGGTIDLIGSNSTQSNSVSVGDVTQNHALVGQNSSQNSTVSVGEVAQVHALVGSNSSQSSGISTGSVSQAYTLSAQNTSQVSSVSVGILAQTHTLPVQNVSQSQSVTLGTVSQGHNLVSSNLVQSASISLGTLSVDGSLVGSSVSQSQAVTNGTLTQTHALNSQSVSQTSSVTTGSLTGSVILSASNVTQLSSVTVGLIAQNHTLIGQTVSQSSVVTNGTISVNLSVKQTSSVSVGNLTQVHGLQSNNVTQNSKVTLGAFPSDLKPSDWFADNKEGNKPARAERHKDWFNSETRNGEGHFVKPNEAIDNPRLFTLQAESRFIPMHVESRSIKI